MGSSWISPYQLESETVRFENGQFQGTVIKTTDSGEEVRLPLVVSFLESGVARVTLDEEGRMNGEIELRHGSKARKERYNEAGRWALIGGLELSTSAVLDTEFKEGFTKVVYGPKKNFQALIRHAPLEFRFQRDGETHIRFNGRGLLNVEHWRAEDGLPETGGRGRASAQREDENMWWDESFGGNTDSKPRGPESVGLDITFPGYHHVFGIPEHADSLSLKGTR
jgi:mannosyl-oligosaccharide alpha-1,3-glucosidase